MSRPLLYDLLPEIYRLRDAQTYDIARAKYEAVRHGRLGAAAADPPPIPPAKALFFVLQQLYDELEDDIGALYNDWFVETCQPEMLPLLAEPLAIRDIIGLQRGGADIRALVANIVRYRQRKGTAGALAGVARDVTGWAVQAVDGLRSTAANARVDDSPFISYYDVRTAGTRAGSAARTVRSSFDVHSTMTGLRTVLLKVWRTRAFFTSGVEPGRDPVDGRKRTISALGHDKVVMRPAQLDDGTENDSRFAMPLTREDARQELASTGGLSCARIMQNGSAVPIQVADLSAWRPPERPAASGTVYFDPEMGRLLTPDAAGSYHMDCFTASYHGIGASVPSKPWSGAFDLTIVVARAEDTMSSDVHVVSTLDEALSVAAIAPLLAAHVRIVLADSRTHRPAQGAWTFDVGGRIKTLSIQSGSGARPTLEGELRFTASDDQRVVLLRGLNMRGTVCCTNVRLIVDTCTIHSPLPGESDIAYALEVAVNGTASGAVAVENSIVGDCAFGGRVTATIQDSIVMGRVEGAAAGGEPDLIVRRSTFLSPVEAASLSASDSLFDSPIHIVASHRGYLRHCAVRPESSTPQRYRCIETAQQLLASTSYGKLHFARLRDDAPPDVRSGASNESEIGAFNGYAHDRRAANLERVRQEFLPEGVGWRVKYQS